MNKMIKRQDIVPPWIEKQQELAKAAHTFRTRLRSDWKRHAVRMIASRGGTLDEQIARAAAYARAEEAHNPRRRNIEQISIPTNSTDDVVMLQRSSPAEASSADSSQSSSPPSPSSSSPSSTKPDEPDQTIQQPFRDPAWEAAELAYHRLAIANLNNLTRSYNLMAPELAKKPYFSLERELRGCFADVAPQVAAEIRARAAASTNGPAPRSFMSGSLFFSSSGKKKAAAADAGLFGGEGFSLGVGGGGGGARLHEPREKMYGLREWWRDLWKRDEVGRTRG